MPVARLPRQADTPLISPTPERKSPVLEEIERLCRGLTDIPLTAHEVVEEFGEPSGWEYFEEAYQWMRDVAEG